MKDSFSRGPVLLVIDVQRAFDNADYWGARNNPRCEANIAALLKYWHDQNWPVVLVKHDSTTPGSPLAPGAEGNSFKEIPGLEGDLLISKRVNSVFYGDPDLDAWMHEHGLTQLAIYGITTNHCCETTARMAGNLGYDTYFVLDATHTFDRRSPDGELVKADELARVTATNLHGEFATVTSTRAVLEALASWRLQSPVNLRMRDWDCSIESSSI